jgi:hypothetical protein
MRPVKISLLCCLAAGCTPDPTVELKDSEDTESSPTSGSDTDTDAPSDTETATDTAPSTPGLPAVTLVLSPNPATAGDLLTLELTFDNYELVNPTATPPPEPADGEGHFHVLVDGVYTQAAWEPQTSLRTVGWTPGSYEITVDLVTSSHEYLEPPVQASVTVTLE